MKYETGYVWRVAGSLSQVFNTIFLNGHPDESISGRAWRYHLQDPDAYKYTITVKFINTLFFFDKDHCREAYHLDLHYAQTRLDMHNKLPNGDR